jgi:hypothetical protein
MIFGLEQTERAVMGRQLIEVGDMKVIIKTRATTKASAVRAEKRHAPRFAE